MIIPPGFVDIVGPFLGDGTFYRGVTEDGVHLPVLAENVAMVFG